MNEVSRGEGDEPSISSGIRVQRAFFVYDLEPGVLRSSMNDWPGILGIMDLPGEQVFNIFHRSFRFSLFYRPISATLAEGV